jgi:hypothetical protein
MKSLIWKSTRSRLGALAFALASFALLLLMPALAQQTTGSISGTVADTSGAVIPGVEVKLTNTNTGSISSTKTDHAGNYLFLLLPPGTYSIDVSNKGFKTYRREGIIVEVNRSLGVPVTLAVGATTETIEVVAGTPLLDPNTSSVGTTVTNRSVADLPVLGRNVSSLANLVPTVHGYGNFGNEVYSTWSMGQVVIAGSTPLNNAFLVDGISAEKMTDYGLMAFLPTDATQEFKVVSNNMSAEYGRSGGGVISMISKSGGNAFHGNAFEYVRNTVFNTADFFANAAGAASTGRAPLHYNIFGGTIGGPIKKDKLFFFFNFEEFRERRFAQTTITSPTDLQRSGDFSATFATVSGACSQVTVYDPATTRADPSRPGSYIRDPYPGNKIPGAAINPIAAAILKYYPSPNKPGIACSGAQNTYLSASTATNKDNEGLKIDYNLSPSKRLSGRVSHDYLDRANANYFKNLADPNGYHVLEPRKSAWVEYTDSLTPTLLLDARFGVNREHEQIVSTATNFDVSSLGFSQHYSKMIQQGRKGDGFPSISITDIGSMGYPDTTGNPVSTGTANATVTKIYSAHTLKVGFEERLYRRSDYGTSNSSGAYAFGRTFTQGPDPQTSSTLGGYGLATFLLGDPTSGSAGITTDTSDSMKYSAAFVQDDWKVNQRLTLNLGMRWEYEGPVSERRNVFPNFDPNVASPLAASSGLPNLKGGYIFPGTNGIPRGLTDVSKKNFGPRFGFAYQFDPKSVLRGGYGISYIPTFGPGGTASGAGFSTSTSMVASLNSAGIFPTNSFADPFPTGLVMPTGNSLGLMTLVGQSASVGPWRDLHRGYSQQWNLTLQRQPWNNWLFELGWVGNKGTHITMGQSLDQLNYQQYLSLGSQLTSTVTNPFYGQISTGTLAAKTITLRQSLLPYPQFTGVSSNAYIGDSIYHALTFKVEKRFSKGFSLLGSYVFSKLIDDIPSTGRTGAVPGTSVQDYNNLRGERSRSYQDQPQRVVITGSWEIPYHPSSSALKYIAGGWQVNGINTMQSGRPIAIAATITGGGDRPNVVTGADVTPANQSLSQWFNTAAFTQPASFTLGNSTRVLNGINGPALFNIDGSVFKYFPIKEAMKLQFRAEVFNLTNTPSFEVPGRTFGSSTFGVVTATTSPAHVREMQLALQLQF